MSTANDGRRIRELDGIRAVAILAVIFWHYFECVPKAETATVGLQSVLSFLASQCWSGVDLFFVLSGFLIGGIILDNCGQPGFLRVFWIRRACRILPALLLLLGCGWLANLALDPQRFAWLFRNPLPWWSYLTFSQNIVMALRGGFGPSVFSITWSLGVEEQFYLMAPLLFLLFGIPRCLKAIPALVTVAFLLRTNSPGFHAFVTVFFRMDALLAGLTLAAISRNEPVWATLHRYRTTVLGGLVMMLLVTVSLTARSGFGSFLFAWFALLYTVLLTVVLLYRGDRRVALFRSPYLCFFGEIAYGLYLFHQGVSGLLHGWLCKAAPSVATGAATQVTLLSFLATIALASLSYHLFEKHILRLGRRLQYRQTAPTTKQQPQPEHQVCVLR